LPVVEDTLGVVFGIEGSNDPKLLSKGFVNSLADRDREGKNVSVLLTHLVGVVGFCSTGRMSEGEEVKRRRRRINQVAELTPSAWAARI
jgi:hypothetical protein